jgi:hypothetical protein
VNPIAPGAPTIGTTTAGDTQATVAFTAPANTGGTTITGYTVTTNPADVAPVSGAGSPIVVTGLTNGQAYTFTVTADNAAGTGPASAASNSVTPAAAQTITFANPGAQAFGTTPTLTATSDSGLTVTFTSSTTGVCTITSGGALTFVTAGTCTINADQAGNASFLAATRVSRSFTVNAVVPGAPTAVVATAGDAQATISFTAPASNGGAAITAYTVTSTPGGITGTGASSPITVTGLTNGTGYTFTVRATNSAGLGPASAASNSVVPQRSQAPFVAPRLRPDRVVATAGAAVDIDVLANDSIDDVLRAGLTLTIVQSPLRGEALIVDGPRLRYLPPAFDTGRVDLTYRVCFSAPTPCVEASVVIQMRTKALTALEWTTPLDRGFRDEPFAGVRALPSARFIAHGLVAPDVRSAPMDAVAEAGLPWSGGRTATFIRRLPGGSGPRDWRVLVDARSASGGDVDLYLGVDANGNNRADADEVGCASAMSSITERCDLAATAQAAGEATYWIVIRSATASDVARVEIFETPLDQAVSQRTLAATGPGQSSSSEAFNVRFVWNAPDMLPGDSRGGWLQILGSDGQPVDWLPVRINRTAGEPTAFALASGIPHAFSLLPEAPHERLFIDVPPGAARLEVVATSSQQIELFLARSPMPAISGDVPVVLPAPPRAAALVRVREPGGTQRSVIENPAAGRWYVTPVVDPLGTRANLVVTATITGAAPRVRPGGYFNPARSGNGLFIYPAGGEWAGLWYTYLQDGTTTWYYLQAAAPGPDGLWRSPIFRSAWDGGRNVLTVVGVATVTPRSASAFTFSYTLDGETGSEAYTSFGGGCPTFGGAPLDVSGHWFDPARAGTGYSVQLFPDYEFYLVFGYDAQGVPRYLVAERNGIGGATATLGLEQNTGACPLCTRTGNPVRSTVGTLTRTFGNGTLQRIQLSGAFTAGVPGTWAANDAVVPLGGLQGCGVN